MQHTLVFLQAKQLWDLKSLEDVTDIPALQPELRDATSLRILYCPCKRWKGIITINEARDSLG